MKWIHKTQAFSISSLYRIRHLIWLGFVCLSIIFTAGCAYTATKVHKVFVNPLLKENPPQRTAFLGLVINANFQDLNKVDDQLELTTFSFALSDSQAINPLGMCPQVVDSLDIIPERLAGFSGTRSNQTRKANTLLEAYCTCKGDLEILDLFKRDPTGFAKQKLIDRKHAIIDSLSFIAHAYVKQSLERHLDQTDELGTLLQHEEAFTKILDKDPMVYKRIMSSLLETGNIQASDIVRCCEILDVEALLCVAVSYNFSRILHSNQYGSWYSIAIHTETDAVVFSPNAESAVAHIQFSRTHGKHLDGLSDVGKLVSKGLKGKLKDSNPTSRL